MQSYPPPGVPNLAHIEGPTSYQNVGRRKLRRRRIDVKGDKCTVAAVGKAGVDFHNPTVLDPQALGEDAELQQTLTAIQDILTLIESELQEENTKLSQLTTHLHDLTCTGIHTLNRSIDDPSQSIFALPPAPGQPAPAGFPSTASGLITMTSEAAAAFLQAYNLPTGGTKRERINRLARHIGIERGLM
eukprot:CAMPEP_0202900490 /NCGR_PEP_ID=MMETSP1392-20130828/11862_1 /ASSEMBLY_ACC=CAM_ASM_000868 /TAXON_ID=225041 /ORGANISM="Chlamydomonas chlamydogama, Strain SAG 11-48b" /LENGTH=187 /DNA_ID=CAMNT_0049586887 /DNA_START=146 /DNA_END=709 /DNA_ORIENTATION=+